VTPTPRLLVLGFLLAATATLLAFYPSLLKLWLVLPLLLLFFMAYDLFSVFRIQLEGGRKIRQVLSHRAWSDVTLNISNTGKKPVYAQVHDMHPQLCQVRGLPVKKTLDARSVTSLIYEALPQTRGNFVCPATMR